MCNMYFSLLLLLLYFNFNKVTSTFHLFFHKVTTVSSLQHSRGKGEAETIVGPSMARQRKDTVAFFSRNCRPRRVFATRCARLSRNWNPWVLVFLDPRRFLGAPFPFLPTSFDSVFSTDSLTDKISSKENTSSPSRVVLARQCSPRIPWKKFVTEFLGIPICGFSFWCMEDPVWTIVARARYFFGISYVRIRDLFGFK